MTKGCGRRASINCYSVKTLDKIGDRKHLVVEQASNSFNDPLYQKWSPTPHYLSTAPSFNPTRPLFGCLGLEA